MQRDRIDQVRADFASCEMFAERIAPRMAHGELVVHARPVFPDAREPQIGALQAGAVAFRNLPPALRPCRQVRQLDVESRGLKPIHPEIPPHDVVEIPAVRTMNPDMPRPRLDILPPRNKGPSLAARGEILGRVETERAAVANEPRSDGPKPGTQICRARVWIPSRLETKAPPSPHAARFLVG